MKEEPEPGNNFELHNNSMNPESTLTLRSNFVIERPANP